MGEMENEAIIHDFHPRFRVYESGRVERLIQFKFVPPSPDLKQDVLSKDVVVSGETGVSVRLFIPSEVIRSSEKKKKLPVLIYAHGGAFCLQSAFSSEFHTYLSSVASLANAIAVSIDYRLAPENPIPASYEDSWEVIQWVASHHTTNGPDSWLNDHADLTRLHLAGDSAGANIMHNMPVRAGSYLNPNPAHLKIAGAALIHPFFGNEEPSPLWECMCPDSEGIHDPRLNPAADPKGLASIGTGRVLIFVAGDDDLKDRGVCYYEALKGCGWGGEVAMVETDGVGHVFHVFDQECEKALALFKRLAEFVNGGW